MSKCICSKLARVLFIVFLCLNVSGCIGTVVGAVVDTTIEVVKIPFKVGAAVVDIATGDDEFTDTATASSASEDADALSSDAAAVQLENAEFE